MDNLPTPIIGATIIINLRDTLSTTTTVMFSLRTEARTTLKVKELAYIKFLIPLPIPTMIFTSLNPLLLNLKLVKIIYYITLFFFVDVVISYFWILVLKSQFFLLILFYVTIYLHSPLKPTI